MHQAVQGNRSLTYSYNGGQLSAVQDDNGRVVTLEYSGDNLTAVNAPTGRIEYKYEDSPTC
ncbi:MAG: hypothetical protein M5U34_27010 [Chloroflexi bacterium]|nr:hypothetical protein [Chloroflexota bacterium]